ncbi:MAG TPA: hypothetical protein VMW62_07700, partial [Chloroflexota bacterium]|nr:hypothetical protein [Chloroflexota bacterium]
GEGAVRAAGTVAACQPHRHYRACRLPTELSDNVPNLLATPQLHGPGSALGVANVVRLSSAIYQYFES